MADERKYYVLCGQNCKFESMSKEQILTAIAQAVESGEIKGIDTGFIQTIKTINNKPLRFFVGEQSEYDTLSETEKQNLFAIITNDTFMADVNASFEELRESLEKLISGEKTVSKALTAKSASHATSADGATHAGTANSATEAHRLKVSQKSIGGSESVQLTEKRVYIFSFASPNGSGSFLTVTLYVKDNSSLSVSTVTDGGYKIWYNPTSGKVELRSSSDSAINVDTFYYREL